MSRHPGLVLAACSLGMSLILMDTTVVNIAAPTIRDDLDASASTLQWVINAYTLMFAALLLSMGALSDRLGARRVFLAGLVTFAAGSAAAGAAPSAAALIAAQAVLGVGAALVLPTSLALLVYTYPEPVRRARAVGVWAAGSAVAFALGPVIGGALTDALGWRWIFIINLPLALLAALLAWREAPPGRAVATAHVDVGGQAATIVALGALTFGLIEGGDRGWSSALVLGAFALAAVTGLWLVGHERRAASPLLPASLLADRRFSASTVAGGLANFAFYGNLFVLSLFVQQHRGMSALEAGLAFLPQPLAFMAAAPFTSRLIGAVGPRLPVALGGAVATLGSLVLLGMDETSPYLVMGAGLALTGLGGAFIIPAVTATVMGAAPRRLAGVASAGLNAGRQVGGAIGVALLGTIAAGSAPVTGLHLAVIVAALSLVVVALLARALPRARELSVAPAAAEA